MPFDFIGLANVVCSGLLTGAVYGLLALGLSVIFGVARVVNFAHGEITALAMYAAAILFASLGVDPFVAVAPLAAGFFIFGYLLHGAVIHRFVDRPEHAQFILLLAIAIVITNGLLIAFGPDARAVSLDYLLESVEVGPLLIDRGKLYAAAAALSAAAALFLFFRFTATGTAIRACADNLQGARIVGLDVKHLYALAFGLGAASASVAGCMLAVLAELTPGSGPAYTLLAFVIVIVGGLGSMTGALIGGALIGVAEALAGFYAAPSAKSMFSFALLIVVLLFRPRGLLGGKP